MRLKQIHTGLNNLPPALAALLFAAGTGLFLWLISDAPPYGTPLNELNDHYWGITVNMAHQVRSGHLDFWTRSVGGGASLFSSGTYPILDPFNLLALVLNDDHFFLFKIIEPFMVGAFFCFLLLRSTLRSPVYLAAFGSFMYLGFIFGRHSAIMQHPLFLYGGALLPGYLVCCFGLPSLPFLLRAALMGGLLAVQFFLGGVIQLPHITIFIMILLTIQNLGDGHEPVLGRRLMNAALASAVAMIFFLLIASPQLLATMIYLLHDSNRTPGQYAINNFPLFFGDSQIRPSIMDFFVRTLFNPGGASSRSFWVLALISLVSFKNRDLRPQPCLRQLGMAGIIFFLLPPALSLTALLIPPSAKLFSPFTMFNFRYLAYLIDIILVVYLVAFLKPADPAAPKQQTTHGRKPWLKWIAVSLSVLYITSPILMWYLNKHMPWLKFPSPLASLIPASLAKVTAVAALTLWCLVCLLTDRLRHRFVRISYVSALIILSVLTMITGYKWGGKGQRGDAGLFYFDTPEYQFYSKAKDLFFLPYSDRQAHILGTMDHNYNLRHEVAGLNGYMCIPSRRFNAFMNRFHNERFRLKFSSAQKYALSATPASLTTYWPVNFTTIYHGQTLPWPGFKKIIDGQVLDIWINPSPVPRARPAHALTVTGLDQIIEHYDQPWSSIIYVETKDAGRFGLKSKSINRPDPAAAVSQWRETRPGQLSFEVSSNSGTWVMVSDMFQQGWEAFIDGRRTTVFPADYLMLGLSLPSGHHHVRLCYNPPLLRTGTFLCFTGLVLLGGWVWRSRSKTSVILRPYTCGE